MRRTETEEDKLSVLIFLTLSLFTCCRWYNVIKVNPLKSLTCIASHHIPEWNHWPDWTHFFVIFPFLSLLLLRVNVGSHSFFGRTNYCHIKCVIVPVEHGVILTGCAVYTELQIPADIPWSQAAASASSKCFINNSKKKIKMLYLLFYLTNPPPGGRLVFVCKWKKCIAFFDRWLRWLHERWKCNTVEIGPWRLLY